MWWKLGPINDLSSILWKYHLPNLGEGFLAVVPMVPIFFEHGRQQEMQTTPLWSVSVVSLVCVWYWLFQTEAPAAINCNQKLCRIPEVFISIAMSCDSMGNDHEPCNHTESAHSQIPGCTSSPVLLKALASSGGFGRNEGVPPLQVPMNWYLSLNYCTLKHRRSPKVSIVGTRFQNSA